MPEITLSEERIGKVNQFVGDTVHPSVAQHNRYQHGFINGVIAAMNVVFEETKPTIEVRELYADAQASMKDLGHEAMCLLQEMPDHLVASDGGVWMEKRRKLLDCWHFNTQARLQNAMNGDDPGVPETGILVADNQEHTFMSKGGLHTLQPVERASKDGGGMFFRRIVLGPKTENGSKSTLYAEHVISSAQEAGSSLKVRHRRIGVISVPKWLQIETVEEPCLSE